MADVITSPEAENTSDDTAWDGAKKLWNKELFTVFGMKVDVGDVLLTAATLTPLGAAARLAHGTAWAARAMGWGSKAAGATATGAKAVASVTSAALDSKVATTTGSAIRSMLFKPAVGPTGHGTIGVLKHSTDTLLHKAGDDVYKFSKGRAIATVVGALALDGTVTDGAIGRTALSAAGTVFNGASAVGGAALNGGGKLAQSADNKITGGQGQQLVDQATSAVTGTVSGAGGAQGAAGSPQEETVVEQDAHGNQVRVPASQAQQTKLQRTLSGMMDKAKDNPAMALGIGVGALMGMKSSDSMMEAAIKVPIYAAIMGFIFNALGPVIMPLMRWAGVQASGMAEQFSGASTGLNGQSGVPQRTPQLNAPAAAPAPDGRVSTQFGQAGQGQSAPENKPVVAPKAPTTGEDAVLALFSGNGAEMTGDVAPAIPAQRAPVRHRTPEAVI